MSKQAKNKNNVKNKDKNRRTKMKIKKKKIKKIIKIVKIACYNRMACVKTNQHQFIKRKGLPNFKNNQI
jgi:hypothetical protein